MSSWSPADGWNEIRRTTVQPAGSSLTLEEAFDSTECRYLSGERAAGFNNPHNGTTLTRTGYIGVTVVLFENGQEQGRLVNTTDYSFDVTNVGNVNVAVYPGEAATQTGSAESGGIGPGGTGNQSITVENAGTVSGTLRVFLANVNGSENGFTDAEADVDADQDSELLEQLEIRIAVVTDTGRDYLLGGPNGYVPLTRLVLSDRSDEIGSVPLPAGARRAVVVEWSLPESAGNGIMTDTADWDLTFVLESDVTND